MCGPQSSKTLSCPPHSLKFCNQFPIIESTKNGDSVEKTCRTLNSNDKRLLLTKFNKYSLLLAVQKQLYLLQPLSEDILRPYIKVATDKNNAGCAASTATVQLHHQTTQTQRGLEIHLTFISPTPTVVSHVHVVACERCTDVGLRAAESGAAESVVQEVRGGGRSRVEARVRQDPNRKKRRLGVFTFFFLFFCPAELWLMYLLQLAQL